jgi:biopolymer transport protein ExbB/TolQ
MIDWFQSGGFLMWPVLAAGIAVTVQTVRAWRARRGADARARAPASTVGSILFWGAFATVVGLIGTLGGVGQMARYMEGASGVPASLVWGGLKVTLPPTVLGLAVLTVALCGWASLRLTAPADQEGAAA